MRPGSKWIAEFREPIDKDMSSVVWPESSNSFIKKMHRVGTLKEQADVVYKLLSRGILPNHLVLGWYTDDKELKIRWVPDSWIELLSPKDRPTMQNKASL
ncbi:hypothetical protein LCGC14_3051820 [marine sediment metagenome]|uniref:Uncharacterized protein n=1 Tax=marine sediment metagenome TaxID=412755 RepID=A0A0F8WLE6_9ZZZZ